MRKKFITVVVVFIISGVFFSVYATSRTTSDTVTLYTIDSQSFLLFEDSATINYEEGNLQDKADKTIHALESNVNFSLQNDGLFPVIKNGITVKVKQGTAYVNFSKAFVREHCGGTLSEKMTIYSLVNTLTSLKGIHQVYFTVNEKSDATFKGHMDLSQPYQFNDQCVCSAPL